jgi:FkbM family methyltransferase
MKLVLNKEIDLEEVLIDAKPFGIIDVGAYIGNPWRLYDRHGVKNRCWIEANPKVFNDLVNNVPEGDVTLNYAIGNKDGNISFIVTNNGQSSSILSLDKHLSHYPDILPIDCIVVKGRRLDTLIKEGLIDITQYNMLITDLQGAEYLAFEGFKENIDKIDYIVSEINYEELYKGCMLVDDFDKYLDKLGFEKIMATKHESVGWGDGYYKRR